MTRVLLVLLTFLLCGVAGAGERCLAEPGWLPTRAHNPKETKGWVSVPKPMHLARGEGFCVKATDPENGKPKYWQIQCGVNGLFVVQWLASAPGTRTFENYCPVVLHGKMTRCLLPCPAKPAASPVEYGAEMGAGRPAVPSPDPTRGRVLFVSTGHGGRADAGERGRAVRVLVDGKKPVKAARRLSTTVGGPDRRCGPRDGMALEPGGHFYTVPGTPEGRRFEVRAGECTVIRVGGLQAGPTR